MKLRVLGRVTSINVRKVLWALDELGLDYEREDWGQPLRDPRTPEFLALNPNGLVPVLIDRDFVLWESNAIIGYLADREGRLVPSSPQQRALVDQWLSWQVGELNPQWGYAVSARLRRNPAFSDETRIAQSIAAWEARLRVLDGHLRSRRYLVGDAFSIADIAVALSSHRWFSTPLDRPDLPAVAAHYEMARDRAAGARWMSADTP
jgi:glutathione S-transferase